MAAYIIAHVQVSDADGYVEYASQTVAIAEEFGGKFLVKGGACEWLEGGGSERNVIIEFPDVAAAKRFYNSTRYQEILPIAKRHSSRDMVLVEGV